MNREMTLNRPQTQASVMLRSINQKFPSDEVDETV